MFSKDELLLARSSFRDVTSEFDFLHSSSRNVLEQFKSSKRFALSLFLVSNSFTLCSRVNLSLSWPAICCLRISFSSSRLAIISCTSFNFSSNAVFPSVSSSSFFCKLFTSSTASFCDFSASSQFFSSLAILLFWSSTTLSKSVIAMFDFLISSLRHSSCSSFSSRSFLHLNSLSLFIVSNDKIEAAWASTLASSSLFCSRILIFSSCALFKRFSSSRDLFKAIMNAFFSSSSLLMQRVCSFSSLVACSSSWLKLATVFFSRSSSESNLSELLFASASATPKSELWFFAFSSSWVSLETFFFSHSSSASNSSDVFVACSNATVTSAWVKLSDSASFSLFSNIFVFSTASAVTAAIWLSLCAKAAPNFSFCKLSFSIRLRTSLISRDSRVSAYRGVVGDDGSSAPSLPSASCSWIVSSVRSWRSCLLSSWISRLEFSAVSSFASKDPFSSKTATIYW